MVKEAAPPVGATVTLSLDTRQGGVAGVASLLFEHDNTASKPQIIIMERVFINFGLGVGSKELKRSKM